MENQEKRAQNPIDIRSLSEEVFSLDDGYSGILNILGIYGPKYLSHITKLSKDKHSKWELNQRRVYRRMFGTKKLFGLLDKDYVFEYKIDEHKRGNPKKVIALTLKGILAALSTGLKLDDIFQFKNFVDFVCSKIDNDNLKLIIKDYFKNQIYFFLVWHAVHGIQLQKQIGSMEYFSKFFQNFDTLPHALYEVDKKEERYYLQCLKNYNAAYSALHILDHIANPNRDFKFGGESKGIQKKLQSYFLTPVQFDFVTESSFQKSGETVIGLVQKWPYHIQYLYQYEGKNVIRIPKTMQPIFLDGHNGEEKGIVIDEPIYYKKLERYLKNFMKKEMLELALFYFSDKRFEEKFHLYEYSRLPFGRELVV